MRALLRLRSGRSSAADADEHGHGQRSRQTDRWVDKQIDTHSLRVQVYKLTLYRRADAAAILSSALV